MNHPHLWLGRWLEDAELQNHVPSLSNWCETEIQKPYSLNLVLKTAQLFSLQLADSKSRVRKELDSILFHEGQMSETETKENLNEIIAFLKQEALEQKVLRELPSFRKTGVVDLFDFSRPQLDQPEFEAWAPLGLLVHIAPTNAFSVGVLSVLEGLLTGNLNFLKTGSTDSLFPQFFLKAFCDCDPSGTLKNKIIVARISSKKQNLLKEILSHADGVAAWGGEEGIEGIRKLTPPQARFIEWGPKISFAYVSQEIYQDLEASNATLTALAEDCCRLEQQACSSPQCIYLETSTSENSSHELNVFADRLAETFQKVSKRFPKKQPDSKDQAEITSVTELAKLESCLGLTRVIEPQSCDTCESPDWRILVEYSSGLRASPLYRTIWLKPLSEHFLVKTLRPLRFYLQTAALACPTERIQSLTNRLIQAGVLRITEPGRMLESYRGEPHDGVYALQRYCKRVSLLPGERLKTISSFSELKIQEPARIAKQKPILTKSDFQKQPIADKDSHLFFKSGGSSGEPKLSIFTYEDYHLQMAFAAEGLFAAGLNPKNDRCMNLFYGGGLYGGFISFFTILESLRAIQFPMAAHHDFQQVAESIIKNRVNTLLGMPSYLLQLFRENDQLFKTHRMVEKIFYGGEHFSDLQRSHFATHYGIHQIRSATYGSVDAGPLGFQCQHCTGSIHHLHHRLHQLEILELEKDQRVTPGIPGRLIFTSLARRGQTIERYEIGDIGREIHAPCSCGRQSLRFELLGRHGDVFRVGATYLSYLRFARILEDYFNYSGEFQIHLYEGDSNKKESLDLWMSAQPELNGDTVKHLLFEKDRDLKESVLQDQVLNFNIVFKMPQDLVKSAGSGKLRRVIDHRSFAKKGGI